VNLTTCRRCLKPVLLARTEAHGKLLALDPEPNPEGRQAVMQPPAGPLQTRQLGKNEQPRPYETLHMIHLATCTGRKQPEPQTPVSLPANVVDFTRAKQKRRGTQPLNRRRT
jgi:hypothetical protein